MSEIKQPIDRITLQEWIDAIVSEASDELTNWEISFIDNIQEQLNRYGRLSEKQEEILERIYAEKTR
jgi:hypothetical protein